MQSQLKSEASKRHHHPRGGGNLYDGACMNPFRRTETFCMKIRLEETIYIKRLYGRPGGPWYWLRWKREGR
jgi:hypothetical protein